MRRPTGDDIQYVWTGTELAWVPEAPSVEAGSAIELTEDELVRLRWLAFAPDRELRTYGKLLLVKELNRWAMLQLMSWRGIELSPAERELLAELP